MILVIIIIVFYIGNLFYFIIIDYYKYVVNIIICMCNKKIKNGSKKNYC